MTTMSDDLISRQAAIDAAIKAIDDWDGEYNITRANMIEKELNDLPPAQSEIIHCEHCRHGVHSGRGDIYLCIASPEKLGEHKYDFFCGYGERK